MLTFLLAASIGLGTPDAKLVAVVASHLSESSVDASMEISLGKFVPPSVRPLREAFGRMALPEVDLLPAYEELPPYFRTRP